MKSWRSSLFGLTTAFFLFIAFSPETFHRWPWLIMLAKFATAGGLASLGLVSKDAAVHSTVGQVEVASIVEQQKEKQKAVDKAADAEVESASKS